MSAGSGYDQAVTTFSPDGRVFQVEYAEKAGDKTGTVLGIKCKDGIVIGIEKTITSKLLLPGGNKRFMATDLYSGIAVSGLVPDGRALGNAARDEAKENLDSFGSHILGRVLAERVAGRVHAATISWQERPFGVSVLLMTYDQEDGPALYLIKPSGTVTRQFAAAIGKHRQGAKTELEKINFNTVTAKEAVAIIANTLYKLHDDVKDKPFELEMVWLCTDTKYKVGAVPSALLETAVQDAKAARERSLMEDSDDDDE